MFVYALKEEFDYIKQINFRIEIYLLIYFKLLAWHNL
jgi:hypothetical protein